MTVPPGATLADTRRQLVLRAFASTNGDYARTATIVGMAPADVRAEIASLVNGKPSETLTTDAARNGARVAKPVELPPATGSRIQHVGRLPIGALPPGTYELRIRAVDGGRELSRTAFFTLQE